MTRESLHVFISQPILPIFHDFFIIFFKIWIHQEIIFADVKDCS
jgi:hypothetical protein